MCKYSGAPLVTICGLCVFQCSPGIRTTISPHTTPHHQPFLHSRRDTVHPLILNPFISPHLLTLCSHSQLLHSRRGTVHPLNPTLIQTYHSCDSPQGTPLVIVFNPSNSRSMLSIYSLSLFLLTPVCSHTQIQSLAILTSPLLSYHIFSNP